MTISTQIAKHVKGVYFDGNWTVSSIKTHLADVTWKEATKQVYGLNSIAALTFHINYYIDNVSGYLEGQPLLSKDSEAFAHPEINNERDWQALQNKIWEDAERFTSKIKQLDDGILLETFIDEKYGNYFHNLMGIVEHVHYHLGQIVILKKIIRKQNQ